MGALEKRLDHQDHQLVLIRLDWLSGPCSDVPSCLLNWTNSSRFWQVVQPAEAQTSTFGLRELEKAIETCPYPGFKQTRFPTRPGFDGFGTEESRICRHSNMDIYR